MICTLLPSFLIHVSFLVLLAGPHKSLLGYARKDFLKESLNISIRRLEPTSTLSSAPNLYPRAYEKFRTFLREIMRPMLQVIEDSDDPNVGNRVLREKGPRNAVGSLSEQINLFWQEDYPFRVLDHEKIDNPLKW